MLQNDFPRYVCTVVDGEKCSEEYGLDDLYIKVDKNGTNIYRLIVCMIDNRVWVSHPIWLNFENLDQTLDRLKLCVTFS